MKVPEDRAERSRRRRMAGGAIAEKKGSGDSGAEPAGDAGIGMGAANVRGVV